MFGPDHYSKRAVELEAEAKRVSDPRIRESYLELAQSFREMANLASLARDASKDADVAQLAERMIGKSSGAH